MPDPSAATRLLGLAAATLLAAACGGPDGRDAAPAPGGADPTVQPQARDRDSASPEPPGSDGGPAQRDAMAWHFSRTSRGSKLVYGERRTDNVRLMLRCPPGGESVVLSFVRPADIVRGRPAEIEIRSGGAAAMLTLDSRESRLGGRIVEAVAPIGLDPLQRFRAGNALHLGWGGETIGLPAGGAHQDLIRRFFETCGPTG